jgi:hypothetical protein
MFCGKKYVITAYLSIEALMPDNVTLDTGQFIE